MVSPKGRLEELLSKSLHFGLFHFRFFVFHIADRFIFVFFIFGDGASFLHFANASEGLIDQTIGMEIDFIFRRFFFEMFSCEISGLLRLFYYTAVSAAGCVYV